MGSKRKDITGQRFGRLIATRFSHRNKNSYYWSVKCDCGNAFTVIKGSLGKNTKSCGCLKRDVLKERSTLHGQASRKGTTKEYRTWSHIKKRCYCKSDRDYRDYGGKGITVCKRWLNSFEAFFIDMGKAPSPKHSIDRIDNAKGYTPKNCRWATPKEQSHNSSRTTLITINKITKSISEWGEYKNLNRETICARINRLGWSVEKAIMYPVRTHPNNR